MPSRFLFHVAFLCWRGSECFLEAGFAIAPASDEARQMGMKYLIQNRPVEDGYSNHTVAVQLSDGELMKDMLDSYIDVLWVSTSLAHLAAQL